MYVLPPSGGFVCILAASPAAMTALLPSPYTPATLWRDAYNECLGLESAAATHRSSHAHLKLLPSLLERLFSFMIMNTYDSDPCYLQTHGMTNINRRNHAMAATSLFSITIDSYLPRF
jgi:hypothetical protein